MKKHKFKVGDVGYVVWDKFYRATIIPITIKQIVDDKCLAEGDLYNDGREVLSTFFTISLRPTPEACAQALVEEFYFNNPKT